MCVYVHTHALSHTHTHAHVHAHPNTHTHTHTHTKRFYYFIILFNYYYSTLECGKDYTPHYLTDDTDSHNQHYYSTSYLSNAAKITPHIT